MPFGRLPTLQEQEAAMQKLADEAATGINLEKALLLRRLLQSGRMEPNIYASGLSPDIEMAVTHLPRPLTMSCMKPRSAGRCLRKRRPCYWAVAKDAQQYRGNQSRLPER